MSGTDWRAEARRYAAPVLIVLLATIGALALRGAVRDVAPQAATKPASVKREPHGEVKRAVARVYVVEDGDTLGQIAEKHGTTVDRLRALNPSVEPTALRVGQRVRVPSAPR